MAEVLFYHLQQQPLEAVLPTLLQKSLERGWRAVVQVTTEERMSALDDHLWTFADESFLPHGTDVQALAIARDQWRAVKEGGHDATYWQQDERGRWQRKA